MRDYKNEKIRERVITNETPRYSFPELLRFQCVVNEEIITLNGAIITQWRKRQIGASDTMSHTSQ